MTVDPGVFFTEAAILAGLFVALALFIRMAASAGTVRSFQFQLSIFLIIWAVSETPISLSNMGLIDLGPEELVGLAIHTVAMVWFAVFVIFRFSKFVIGARFTNEEQQ